MEFYLIHWENKKTGFKQNGTKPVSKEEGNAWVKYLNGIYPELHHWLVPFSFSIGDRVRIASKPSFKENGRIGEITRIDDISGNYFVKLDWSVECPVLLSAKELIYLPPPPVLDISKIIICDVAEANTTGSPMTEEELAEQASYDTNPADYDLSHVLPPTK